MVRKDTYMVLTGCCALTAVTTSRMTEAVMYFILLASRYDREVTVMAPFYIKQSRTLPPRTSHNHSNITARWISGSGKFSCTPCDTRIHQILHWRCLYALTQAAEYLTQLPTAILATKVLHIA